MFHTTDTRSCFNSTVIYRYGRENTVARAHTLGLEHGSKIVAIIYTKKLTGGLLCMYDRKRRYHLTQQNRGGHRDIKQFNCNRDHTGGSCCEMHCTARHVNHLCAWHARTSELRVAARSWQSFNTLRSSKILTRLASSTFACGTKCKEKLNRWFRADSSDGRIDVPARGSGKDGTRSGLRPGKQPPR